MELSESGRHVIASLRARADAPLIRGLGTHRVDHADESIIGDMNDPTVLAAAVEGVDAVIHYGPPMHPRETAMGTGMIDAATAAGVRRFVFISVIHPEIDVPRCVAEGRLVMPYPVGTRLGHVDMKDLADAAALVVMESGHVYATYDVAADQELSVTDLCATMTKLAGKPVEAATIDTYSLIEIIKVHWRGVLSEYSVEACHRLFGYYARHGIHGNPNVLSWLLGRRPGTFEDYVRRTLPHE